MMAVLALPPNEFCSMRVSFESLKGICPFPFLLIKVQNYIDEQDLEIAF